MSLIHNERTKLLASMLSALGIALIVSAVIVPAVSAAYRIGEPMHLTF
jgi:hypothetical protein